MGRMVKRLSGLEIDEVSLVDRPANQHGLVAIAKNHQEEDMPHLFDADDNPVDEQELQPGDYVYDEAGNEYQVAEEDDGEDEQEVVQGDYAEVGKAVIPSGPLREGASRSGFTAKTYGARLGEFARKNKRGLTVGAAGGGVVGYGAGSVGKSAGASFLETISKAVTDEERDEVIAKAFDQFEEVSKRNEALEEAMDSLLGTREHEQFTEVAKSYGLGVDPEYLGGLLQRASHYLPEEDVVALDRLFAGAGEISKQLYVEQGITGYGESSILEQVYAIAGGEVSKAAELGITQEQAVTAIFDTNPAAYDEYLAENPIQNG